MEPRATQGRPAPTRSLDYELVSKDRDDEQINGTYGSGGRVGTAGNVLLAALVEEILDGDGDEDGDCDIISLWTNMR